MGDKWLSDPPVSTSLSLEARVQSLIGEEDPACLKVWPIKKEVIAQHTRRRRWCEDRGRDRSDVARSPGTLRKTSSYQQLEGQGIDSSSGFPEECDPADTLSSDI